MIETKKNFITRLKESAHDNPWLVITVVVTIISVAITSNYYLENISLQKENLELSKPFIIKQDLIVRSKVQNVNFPFNIRNPSNNEHTIDFSKSLCDFDTNLIHKYIPEKTTTINNISAIPNFGNEVIISPSSVPITTTLPPETTIQLQCSGFSVDQTINDTYTFMNVCMKILAFKDLICERIPLTIAKARVVTINDTVS